jgi:hypothetical protein
MRRRRFVSFLGGAALTPPIALAAYAEPVGSCGIPAARDDGWAVASTHDDKLIDREALCGVADRLAASTNGNVHSVSQVAESEGKK